jgi:Bacterial CdiA-CT RNAse A domain
MRPQKTLSYLIVWASVALFGSCGCGPASVPQGTPQNESPRETRAERRAESQPSAGRYDLGRDEERGGHTLKKHVARTDEQLRERMEHERNISAASTWTDRETAETVVAEALSAERGRIEKWSRRGYPRANLALHYDAGRVIGRSLRRGEDATVDCTSAVIVLRADGPDSFYVLTTYPEARE